MEEQQGMEERVLQDDIHINRFKLEVESERQPSLYHYWAELLAKAKSEKDTAEDRLKLILASRELGIREECAEAGIKSTEGSIKAMLESDEKVLQARAKLRETQANVYVLEAAVKSLEHRRDELDNLVQLWIKGYYSKPDGGPRDSAADTFANDVRKKLNK